MSNSSLKAEIVRDFIQLALSPRAAAKALGISERLLWSKTNCGEIPHVRIGKRVLYPVGSLKEWLADKVKTGSHEQAIQ